MAKAKTEFLPYKAKVSLTEEVVKNLELGLDGNSIFRCKDEFVPGGIYETLAITNYHWDDDSVIRCYLLKNEESIMVEKFIGKFRILDD